jgi:hypothetical protein
MSHSYERCAACGWPVTDGLTPMGRLYWTHERIPLSTPLSDVPDDAVSNGTGWVVEHAATVTR